ncbi:MULTISPECIES: hypothetical protein [Olleya]|jgi:predicted small secreted protein|uniref:Uncharacterized protein n=1 Tax=Olleya marilimosa TaxID=272164 RepID=A0ABR8LRB8_9FLAO|nr:MULTISPECIES: hypothetical protein [Olleya]MBD3862006.1 hypothetical protein [Olleya marilimosa]MBD3889500.1 hypothetical protein [Olleya marilimosa]|tara:strand:- start:163 stop:303 length:141 start_codon:yes stop_codon:yes gene_type:complete
MKKLAHTFILLFSVSLLLTGCREESTGEKVEDAVENVADDVEDAVD